MHFQRIQPSIEWNRLIECYWMIEEADPTVVRQKIVPDGFPEIIFHLGDGYRIYINGAWETQSKCLLAGQIRKFFFLENEGRSAVFGVKLKPAAPALLFGIDMSTLTDSVVDLHSAAIPGTKNWEMTIVQSPSLEAKIQMTENFLRAFLDNAKSHQHQVEHCIESIFASNGAAAIEELASELNVSKRQLELYFNRYVGLSPKFYSRIIRFSKIFEWVQDKEKNWSDIVHLAGYYDQAHFIKNFKAFTGEEPGRYGFDKKDFANFFMKKSG